MDNREFDTVKAEKANAIANFRRVRNIAKLLRLFEVFVAFALISWSSTRLPSAVKLAGEYLIVFSGYLFNPHVVFVIGNVIVLALYLLSRNADGRADESDSASADSTVSDEYHECSTIVHNNAAAGTGTASSNNEFLMPQTQTQSVTDSNYELSPPQMKSVMEERIGEDRQIVCYENAVSETECEAAAAAAAIETAKKQIRRFQRTQSEKLKREMSMKPRKDYRRSETEIRRPVITSGNHGGRRAMTSFDTLDRLNSEEFRLKVETFIEKQQSFIKSQKLAENSQ